MQLFFRGKNTGKFTFIDSGGKFDIINSVEVAVINVDNGGENINRPSKATKKYENNIQKILSTATPNG